MTCEVFVRLLDEGTPAWRPVTAARLGDAYVLESPAANDETLEFPVGTVVRCEARTFQGDSTSRLVAVTRTLQWGDAVRVRSDARPAWRPGEAAEVCGIRALALPEQAAHFGAPVGSLVMLVEFSDGSAVEMPESALALP